MKKTEKNSSNEEEKKPQSNLDDCSPSSKECNENSTVSSTGDDENEFEEISIEEAIANGHINFSIYTSWSNTDENDDELVDGGDITHHLTYDIDEDKEHAYIHRCANHFCNYYIIDYRIPVEKLSEVLTKMGDDGLEFDAYLWNAEWAEVVNQYHL